MSDYKIQDGDLLESFDSITGWTVTGTGASISLEENIVKDGTGALRVTSVDGVSAYAKKTISEDLSNTNIFSMWIYIEDLTKYFQSNIATLYLYTSGVNYFHAPLDVDHNMKNGWNRLHFTKSDFTENNTPDWSDITEIKIRALGLAGETVSLIVDDLRTQRYARPKIIITTDDGNETDYTEMFSYMQTKGIKGTAFIYPVGIGAANQMTLAQCQEMYKSGWDIGNHSYDGADLTSVTVSEAVEKFTSCAEYLEENNMPRAAYMLAWPHSAWNQEVVTALEGAGLLVGRNGLNRVTTHDYPHKSLMSRVSVANTTPVSDLTDAVDEAVAKGGVAIFNFHDIKDPSTESVWYTPSDFQEFIDYVSALNGTVLDVVTISEWYRGLTNPRKLV